MDKLLLFGAGGHGKVVLDIAQSLGYSIVGFVDQNIALGSMICGYPVLGVEENLQSIMTTHGVKKGVVCVGDNSVRSQVVAKVRSFAPGFEFPSLVHPRAVVASGVHIEEGAVVMAGAILNPGIQIGSHVIINTGACVDHDCKIDAFASIGPGAVLGGCVVVDGFSVVGLGAKISHGRTVGLQSIVGAGSLVIQDVGDHQVVYGVPAQFIRKRVDGEKYL